METKSPSERTIFLKALELKPGAERQAYLDDACGDDRALRGNVESLLHAHQTSDDLLDQVDGQQTTSFEQPGNWLNQKIGPYVIREQIGEGGMGVVYAAEQKEPVRRKVALKLIKPGMDSRQVIARFEAERQALALMDHPNVARVHDAGTTETGLPYFVMELVNGLPITAYCDRYRLSTEERLQLFIQVCRAVQHAHLKGIIHRDIKPGNILVTQIDGQPVPKVIDFGVAKAVNQQLTDKTIYTHLVQVLGTPLYISPEQAELSGVDVDTRTDVYSLGVLLYELLSGCTPFDRERIAQAGLDEMRRMIREDEPPRPSLRLSTLNAEDRSTISDRRQTEPARLSQTLRGELDWIVMKAMEKDRSRRYESASQLADDMQRYLSHEPVQACPPSTTYLLRKFARKRKAALATAAILVCVILIASAISFWQMGEAIRARKTAELHQQRSESNYQNAIQAVDQMLLRVGAAQLNSVPKMLPVQKQLLDDAVQLYEELVEENPNDLALRVKANNAYLTLYRLNANLGVSDHNQSEQLIRRSIVLVQEGLKIDPEHSASLNALANSYWMHSHVVSADEEAARVLQTALRLSDRLPDKTHAKLCIQLGRRLSSVNSEESQKMFKRAISSARNANDKRLEASANTILGVHFSENGDLDDAANCFERAVSLYVESIPSVSESRRPTRRYELIEVRQKLADVSLQLGQELEAERQLELAWIAAIQLRNQNPKNIRFQGRLASIQNQHVELLFGQGRIEDAFRKLRTSIESSNSPDFARILRLPKLYGEPGNSTLAFNELSKMIALNPDDELLLLLRAKWWIDDKDYLQAHCDLDNVLRLNPESVVAWDLKGKILFLSGDYQASVDAFTQAIEITPKWSYYKNRAKSLLHLRDYPRTIADASRTIELRPQDYYAWGLRADAHVAMGDYDEALKDYSQAIELNTKPHHLKRRSAVHFHLRDFERAISDLERAIELNPSDESTIHWIPAIEVAKCGAPVFQEEMLRLATRAVELSNNSAHVISGRMCLHALLGNAKEAAQDMERIRSAHKQGASLSSYPLNNTAWTLAKEATANAELVEFAVELGELAVAIDPDSGFAHNTLGLAYYRAGEYGQSKNALKKSLDLLGDEAFGFNGVFLAMTHWQLGQTEAARQWLNKSTEWMEEHDPEDEELVAFRQEAESLIGTAAKVAEKSDAADSVAETTEAENVK